MKSLKNSTNAEILNRVGRSTAKLVDTMQQTLQAVNLTVERFNSPDSDKVGYTKELKTVNKRVPTSWNTTDKTYKETYILFTPIDDTKERIQKANRTAELFLKEEEIQS